MADEKVEDPKPEDKKPEEKPPEEKKPEEKPPEKISDTKEPPEKTRVVPEKYDLKLPEGSLLKPESIESVSKFSKEKGLTQEEAQSVLERENTVITAYVEGLEKLMKEESDKWVQEIQNDKELGGDNLTKTSEISKRVLEKYGPELIKELERPPHLGNHPAFVRFMNRLGKAMESGEFVKGESKPGEVKSAAEVLYPNSSPKKEE